MDFLAVKGLGTWMCIWSNVEEPSLCQLGHGLSCTETQHKPCAGFQWDLVVEDLHIIQTYLGICP